MKTSLKKEVFLFSFYSQTIHYLVLNHLILSLAHSGNFSHPSGGASFMLSGTGYSSNIYDKFFSSSIYFTMKRLPTSEPSKSSEG